MKSLALLFLSVLFLPSVAWSDVVKPTHNGPGFHVVQSVEDINVFDSTGAIVNARGAGDGAGGGVFIGPVMHYQPGTLPFSLVGLGGFIVEGAVVSKEGQSANTASGVGIVFVPISFFGDSIHIGYGYNTASKGHVYFGFSIGHLVQKIRAK